MEGIRGTTGLPAKLQPGLRKSIWQPAICQLELLQPICAGLERTAGWLKWCILCLVLVCLNSKGNKIRSWNLKELESKHGSH